LLSEESPLAIRRDCLRFLQKTVLELVREEEKEDNDDKPKKRNDQNEDEDEEDKNTVKNKTIVKRPNKFKQWKKGQEEQDEDSLNNRKKKKEFLDSLELFLSPVFLFLKSFLTRTSTSSATTSPFVCLYNSFDFILISFLVSSDELDFFFFYR
jgi:hypothetical protein